MMVSLSKSLQPSTTTNFYFAFLIPKCDKKNTQKKPAGVQAAAEQYTNITTLSQRLKKHWPVPKDTQVRLRNKLR